VTTGPVSIPMRALSAGLPEPAFLLFRRHYDIAQLCQRLHSSPRKTMLNAQRAPPSPSSARSLRCGRCGRRDLRRRTKHGSSHELKGVPNDGITEQSHQPIAQFFGDVAAHLSHRRRRGVQIRADQITPVLGIEAGRDAGRPHKVAEKADFPIELTGAIMVIKPPAARTRWPTKIFR
jgi:hypothetical protein